MRAGASSIRVELREDAPEGGARAVVGFGELQLDESLWNQQPLRQTLALKAAGGEQVRVFCTARRGWPGESVKACSREAAPQVLSRGTLNGFIEASSPNATMPTDIQHRGFARSLNQGG